MAVVAQTRQRDQVLEGLGTLLALCEAAGLPLASACSGAGSCGRCLVTILEGAESLSPPEQRELDLLLRLGATPRERAGCQCQAPIGTSTLRFTTGYW
jgi:adenylate cyclase